MMRSGPLTDGGMPLDPVGVLEQELVPVIEAAGPGDHVIAPEVWDRVLLGIARELLGRPGKQFRARVVELAFSLTGGGGGELPPVIPQLVELVHAGSLIIDDIEDGSTHRRGRPALHCLAGVPLAINTGNWLYFAAYHLIERAGLDAAATLDVYRRLTWTMLQSHQGQALDLAIDVTVLRQREVAAYVDAASALKAGALTSFAAELGAIAAGAAEPELRVLARFGSALGIGLQHLDDLGGLRDVGRRDKGREDLAGHRLTWPWSYLARTLDEVRFAKLQRELREAGAGDLDALATELAALLGDEAYHHACARIAAARQMLATTFPGHPVLAAIEAELGRVERSYG